PPRKRTAPPGRLPAGPTWRRSRCRWPAPRAPARSRAAAAPPAAAAPSPEAAPTTSAPGPPRRSFAQLTQQARPVGEPVARPREATEERRPRRPHLRRRPPLAGPLVDGVHLRGGRMRVFEQHTGLA